MASFCTQCGVALNPGTQFCTACGAPQLASQTAAQTAPPPYAAAMVPPPPATGPSAVKVILIVAAVIVGLGILGLSILTFTVWRVARTVHVEGNGDKVTVQTPGGTYTANSSTRYTASDLGVDLYPGATNGHGGSKVETPTGSVVTAIFLTPDSKDQVLSFYKSKLGNGASVFDTASGAILSVSHENRESIMVTISSNSSQNEGKTQIAIVHSRSQKSS